MTRKIYASLKLTNHKPPRGTNVLKTRILEPFLNVLAQLCYNDGKNICVIKTNEPQAGHNYVIMTEKIYATLKVTNYKPPRGTNVLKTHILEPFLNILAPLCYNYGKNICVIKTNKPQATMWHWSF